MNDPGNEGLQVRIVTEEREIGPDLVGGITQPHRINVSRDDEGIGFAVAIMLKGDGGIQGVRQAVGKKPGEFRVANRGGDFLDCRFDSLAGEAAFFKGWTFALELRHAFLFSNKEGMSSGKSIAGVGRCPGACNP